MLFRVRHVSGLSSIGIPDERCAWAEVEKRGGAGSLVVCTALYLTAAFVRKVV